MAKSLSPIVVQTMQITKSTNGMEASVGKDRSSDTIGSKSFIDYGVYVVKGSINCFFAEKTGFTDEDKDVVKEALRTLFENDASSARPEGSMRVKDLFWFDHGCKTGIVSSADVFDLLVVDKSGESVSKYEEYNVRLDEERLAILEEKGMKVEKIKGF